MSYHYGQAPGGQHNPYGQQPSFPTTFDAGSTADLHGSSYPPSAGRPPASGSSWSLEEDHYKDAATSGGGGGGGGYVQRGADNPYAANYKGPNGSMSATKKWILAGVALLVVAGVAAGIAVWQVKKNDSSSSTSSSSSSGSSGKQQYINGTAKVVKSNPNDPSDFETDDRLKKIFYGLAYTPINALEEYGCGTTLANITEDVQLMSQLTTRLRTYSTSCNQTQLLLQAIADTKVNMTVWLGAYVGTNETVNSQQQEDILDALQLYGADHVGGITIGNEYILDQTDQTTAITYIKSLVSTFNDSLVALGLSKTIPVGTADAGSVYTSTLATGIDEYLANVHPWFGGVNITDAAGWTWEYFTNNDVAVSEAATNTPLTYIAETGWPTDAMEAVNRTYEGAYASVDNLQIFLDTYPCQANANSSYYFYFEPFDEPWKEIYGGVEPYWGLFDSNKILKDVTFPTCDVMADEAAN